MLAGDAPAVSVDRMNTNVRSYSPTADTCHCPADICGVVPGPAILHGARPRLVTGIPVCPHFNS